MLNVPDDIKELLHRDSCQKNIRIVFPNKERSDICNDLIVKDSVSFTESLCSQDTLKFGLCEAAQFECETVGVGNIKGATIQVFCEIFCPSSVQDALWQTDLQAWVYQIPYGTFIVNSCDRQADMIHRRIVAYGGTWNVGTSKNKYELEKASQTSWSSTYTPKAFHYMIANMNVKDLDYPEIFEKTTVTPTSTTTDSYDIEFEATEGQYAGKTLKWRQDKSKNNYMYGSGGMSISQTDNLFKIVTVNNKEKVQEIADLIDSYGGFPYDREFVEDTAKCIYTVEWNPWGEGPFIGGYEEYKPPIFYGYMNGASFMLATTITYVRQRVYNVTDGNTLIYDDSYDIENLFEKISVKSDYDFFDSIKLSIPAIADSGTYKHNLNSIDNFQVLSECLEMIGLFGNLNRSGKLELIDIKRQFGLNPDSALYPGVNLLPQGVNGGQLRPNDYQSCWYDDEYTKPIGVITITYKDSNNNTKALYMYLPGYSSSSDPTQYKTYDLSNNQIVSSKSWTTAAITKVGYAIAAHVANIQYIPVEFVGRGLPYVEPGDTFEVLTKSGESITTIVLNRTLTGEQTLTDTYKSTGTN